MQMPIITDVILWGAGREDGVVSVKGSMAGMEHHDPRQLEEAKVCVSLHFQMTVHR